MFSMKQRQNVWKIVDEPVRVMILIITVTECYLYCNEYITQLCMYGCASILFCFGRFFGTG